MYVKLVRDDGKIFVLGGSQRDDAAWGITEISGIDSVENTMNTAVPAVGDGAEITGERIPARLERFQCREQPADKHVSMSMALYCKDPSFYSLDNFGKNIAAVTGSFGFPYLSAINGGFRTGVYNFAKRVEIENTGDVETYAKIMIIADGFVENPKICQNDAFIRLKDTLNAGDVVEIDMVGNTIRKNGVNCIGKVDRHSSFSGMVLRPGGNEISFDADNGDTNMKVVLYYNLRYLGV